MLTITDSTIVTRYAHATGVKRAAVEIHDALLKNVEQFLKAAGTILQEDGMTLPDLEARLNECSQFQLKDICTELLSAVGASACFAEDTADKGHAVMFSMIDAAGERHCAKVISGRFLGFWFLWAAFSCSPR